jgi:hypothetical protein
MMPTRGVVVSYETIRQWCTKFGQMYTNGLRGTVALSDRPARPDPLPAQEPATNLRMSGLFMVLGGKGGVCLPDFGAW